MHNIPPGAPLPSSSSVIIVLPDAIIITIVVVSRCAAAYHITRNAITIIDKFISCHAVAESEPKFGVKKTLWWPFIELTQYVSPLLHCELEFGNNIYQMLREVINEYIEHYAPGEESIRTLIPTL